MKNKIMWKDVTLIVLAILLIFSMCRIHTLKQSNKKLYSQNLISAQLMTFEKKTYVSSQQRLCEYWPMTYHICKLS